jgi:hypothetical protein
LPGTNTLAYLSREPREKGFTTLATDGVEEKKKEGVKPPKKSEGKDKNVQKKILDSITCEFSRFFNST